MRLHRKPRVVDHPNTLGPKATALGVWDHWATAPTRGPVMAYRWNPRNASPMVVMDEVEREAWVRSMVLLARRRARDRIAREVREGRWWVPRGFTVEDLDKLVAKL